MLDFFSAVSPSVRPQKALNLAIEFQPQELTCSARGVPPPTITFTRDGLLLDEGALNGRVTLQDAQSVLDDSTRVYTVNRTMEITSPLSNDTGTYTCVASFEVLNQTFSASANFSVIIQGRCILVNVAAYKC